MAEGLASVSSPGARCLILGSVPGRISIEKQQYYANQRNAFWLIAEHMYGISASLPYRERIAQLRESGIALWDVLASCEREGSLDSKIQHGTEVPNDLVAFARRHPQLQVVALNGKKASQLYRRFMAEPLADAGIHLHVIALPSTSPANTRYSLEQKLTAWRSLGALGI